MNRNRNLAKKYRINKARELTEKLMKQNAEQRNKDGTKDEVK